MGQSFNLKDTTRATVEIILTFNSTRFSKAKVREAIQKQTDKSTLPLFIGEPKVCSLTRKSVTIRGDWQAYDSPMSYSKWRSDAHAIASAIKKSVSSLSGVQLIECKFVLYDRDDNTKVEYLIR